MKPSIKQAPNNIAYTVENTHHKDGVYTREDFLAIKFTTNEKETAIIKTHPNKKTAKKYYKAKYPNRSVEPLVVKQKRIKDSTGIYYTDGAFCQQTKATASGFLRVDTDTNTICDYKVASPREKQYKTMNATYSELEAVLMALEDAFQNFYTNVIIYHDASVVSEWVKVSKIKKMQKEPKKEKKSLIKHYQKIIGKYTPYMKITFKKVKAHSGNTLNNTVDSLVKERLQVERKLILKEKAEKKLNKKNKK